ncbi:hypothetical protein SAMN02949497_1649 [Methylomagnum ishizawai]|uniref:DUF5666 domain-containing protein n=1 Tax=Methylomagnum ishizawai TaxID=1760988 RepID=A0A1Y6CUK7_9GAMM|nr:hypothetical protein [Methylomagnum ishizawai]SMF94339.1 hypothetical protein SAMN02949497_1649 [Methylomagnum ishizawai]
MANKAFCGLLVWGLLVGVAHAEYEHTIVSGNWIGCVSKDAYEKLVGFAVAKDMEAGARMMMSGQCTMLQAGTTVYLADVEIFSGSIGIRVRGQTQTIWTAREAVSR